MPGPHKALILPNGITIFVPALYLHRAGSEPRALVRGGDVDLEQGPWLYLKSSNGS